MISFLLNIVTILADTSMRANENFSENLVDNPSALDERINISAKSWLFGNIVDSMVNNTNFKSLNQESYAAEKNNEKKDQSKKSKLSKSNKLAKDSEEESNV